LGSALGTTTSFGISDINGTAVKVLRFPAGTNGSGFNMPTPTSGYGGGSRVNDYTIILDVLYPASGNNLIRPILEGDGGFFTPDTDFIINASNALGLRGGAAGGSIQPNTWYRLGYSVSADDNQINMYVNGQQVASQAYGSLDSTFSLAAGDFAKLFSTIANRSSTGYVASIQMRDVPLNPGQMLAMGGPSATGIPQTIPPVPSYIASRTPGLGATGVLPTPTVTVLVNQGDTTLDNNSFSLALDGAPLAITIIPNPDSTEVDASVTNLLAPDTTHTFKLIYSDSVAGSKTNTWSFTVIHYPVITLPPPIVFEGFDGVAEGALPTGWVVTNATSVDHAGYDLNDPRSDAYLDWVVISTNTLRAVKGGDRLTAEAIEQSLTGRTGIYDIRVTNRDQETVAMFRGKSSQIKGNLVAVES